jgi:hypothetical protein
MMSPQPQSQLTSHPGFTPGVGAHLNKPRNSVYVPSNNDVDELLDAMKYLGLQHKGFHEMSSDELRLYQVIRKMRPMWM